MLACPLLWLCVIIWIPYFFLRIYSITSLVWCMSVHSAKASETFIYSIYQKNKLLVLIIMRKYLIITRSRSRNSEILSQNYEIVSHNYEIQKSKLREVIARHCGYCEACESNDNQFWILAGERARPWAFYSRHSMKEKCHPSQEGMYLIVVSCWCICQSGAKTSSSSTSLFAQTLTPSVSLWCVEVQHHLFIL